MLNRVRGTGRTVEDRVRQYGTAARDRLKPHVQSAGVSYPPTRLILLELKWEKRLDLYTDDVQGSPRFIRSYPILAASGSADPKLRSGDGQVPEGLYRIESHNPNSLYFLALRVNYPNEFDRQMRHHDGRSDLGCDIMIHGKASLSDAWPWVIRRSKRFSGWLPIVDTRTSA